jgi:hypothetical protein
MTLPGVVLSEEDADPFRPWIEAGTPIRLANLSLTMAGVSTEANGDFSFSPDGLLTGRLTARFDSLDHLPDLAEALHPGSRDKVAKAIGPISALLRPVTVDGKPWREMTLTFKDGKMSMGFLPLGRLPPFGREPEPPPEEEKPAPGGEPQVAEAGPDAAGAAEDQAAAGGKPLAEMAAVATQRHGRCAID